MRILLDLCYLIAYLFALPWIVYRYVASSGWGAVPLRLGVGLGEALDDSIWLHASSVGEATLLKPLVRRLELKYPQTPLVISTYTSTGLEAARAVYPRHRVIAFPFDFKWIVRRYLRRLSPKLVIIVESELWPNFIHTMHDRGVPVAIVNGKMSEKSFRMHLRTKFVASALRTIELVAVQSEEHAERMRALGVEPSRLFVTGNMKYDLAAPVADAGGRESMREQLGYEQRDTIIIGASLHDAENAIVLAAYRRAAAGYPHAALVLVPRYPDQAREVAAQVEEANLRAVRKSQLDSGVAKALGSNGILVVDTVGELARLYAISDVAFVGGSLFHRGSNKGGHNLMEPAILGIPVLFGPYNYSFSEAARRLLDANAGIEVVDEASLARAFVELFERPALRRTMGDAARRAIQSGQGATERTFRLVTDLLEPSGGELGAQWT